MRIKVIGLGGIGNWLIDPLTKFLNFSYNKANGPEVWLIDGDDYDATNQDRQTFTRFDNKAVVTKERISNLCPLLKIIAKQEYVNKKNVFELIRENDIVFVCVDNHASRHLISQRCEELDNVVVISGGNHITDGLVQIFVRKNGENITLPLANEFHPEISESESSIPGQAGCEEVRSTQPQLLFTNNAIACVMLNAFYGYLQGNQLPDEVYVDITTNKTRAVTRTQTTLH